MKAGTSVRARGFGRARGLALRLVALSLLCAPTFAPAQDVAQTQDAAQSAPGAAQKWDEFGRVGHCDMGARLDNFANFLQENPEATGYIVGYDPARGSPGIAKRAVEMQRQYMVYARGVAEGRVVAVAAGRHEGRELKSELWIVPPGARPPAEVPPEGSEPPFAGEFASFGMSNDHHFDHSGEMEGVGGITTTRHAFAEVLKRQPGSKAYLVAYADAESAPGAWRRYATSEKMQLEELGVEPSRLVILNGGTRKQSEVEFWVLPEDAPPPVKAKKREKRLREAAMIGAYTHYEWKEDDGEAGERRWVLDNLAEMLREDPQRVGCLVVFQDDDPPEFDEASGEVESPFDYVKLAGEWRRALAERYGIEAHRVVLLVGRPSEWEGGSVETWIVPKGVALPDPAEIVKSRAGEAGAEDEPDAEKP